jgi:hypothetical protein
MYTALQSACEQGHIECARLLLEAGADARFYNPNTESSCFMAANRQLGLLQLLCAYASHREPQDVLIHEVNDLSPNDNWFIWIPARRPTRECRAWFEATRSWTTPLHHFEFMPIERVRALLASGADVHASDGVGSGSPTLFTLALEALKKPSAAAKPRAALIAQVSAWSPERNAHFPVPTRKLARRLLLLGHWLTRKAKLVPAAAQGSLLDVWVLKVIPRAVQWPQPPVRELEPPIRVRVHGITRGARTRTRSSALLSPEQLNGQLGLAKCWDADAGRYGVLLDSAAARTQQTGARPELIALLPDRVEQGARAAWAWGGQSERRGGARPHVPDRRCRPTRREEYQEPSNCQGQ